MTAKVSKWDRGWITIGVVSVAGGVGEPHTEANPRLASADKIVTAAFASRFDDGMRRPKSVGASPAPGESSLTGERRARLSEPGGWPSGTDRPLRRPIGDPRSGSSDANKMQDILAASNDSAHPPQGWGTAFPSDPSWVRL